MQTTAARRVTIAAAGAVAWLVGTLLPLFALAQLARSLGEGFCGADGRLPDGADGYAGPSWTGPARLTCHYGSQGSATFTDWTPLTGVVLAVLLEAVWTVLVCWAARRLLRRAAGSLGRAAAA